MPWDSCPSTSVFPEVFGLVGSADSTFWSYNSMSNSAESWNYFIDVSKDAKYIIAGGYIKFTSGDFFPDADYEELVCNPLECGESSNFATPGTPLMRGSFHFYVDSHFEYRKYYFFGAPEFNVLVDDAKIL